MKSIIKIVLCTILLQAGVYAAVTETRNTLLGTANIEPYTTIVGETHDGKEVSIIAKILSSNGIDVTVVAPMYVEMYPKMKELGIKETGNHITVNNQQVMTYEAKSNGITYIFVGEPYKSGLFTIPIYREVSSAESNKKVVAKYTFLSKAILEIAKAKDYDFIHSCGWGTTFVPWYKKNLPEYKNINAVTIHTVLDSDIFTSPIYLGAEEKEVLNLDPSFYDPFANGSMVSFGKIDFTKMACSATNCSSYRANYISIYNDVDVIKRNFTLIENAIKEEKDPSVYILENSKIFGDKEFLNALLSKAERADLPLTEVLDYYSKANLIIGTLAERGGNGIEEAQIERLSSLPKKLATRLENDRMANTMAYLRTKGLNTEQQAFDYFVAKLSDIMRSPESTEHLSRYEAIQLTAAFIFTYMDNGAFYTPESYTMFMGTKKNEGQDGLFRYLEQLNVDPFKLYKVLTAALVITNPANDNVKSYITDNIDVMPKDFVSLVAQSYCGRRFAEALSFENNDVKNLYLNKNIQDLLPNKQEMLKKLDVVRKVIDK